MPNKAHITLLYFRWTVVWILRSPAQHPTKGIMDLTWDKVQVDRLARNNRKWDPARNLMAQLHQTQSQKVRLNRKLMRSLNKDDRRQKEQP